MDTISIHLLLFSITLLCRIAIAADVSDTLGKGRNITDGETLVSADGTFTLGFFSPGASSSTKRYLGIWFSVSSVAVCWVANGDRPVNGNSGVLVVRDTGSLLLLDGGSGQVTWSSNSPTSSSSSAEAQLRNSGNLVVHDGSGSGILWQSFDHPSNTLLSGMKLGKNRWTGAEWYLTSWRSADDPSPGAYRRALDTSGLPELVVWRGNVRTYRTGPWNGRWFSGVPEVSAYKNLVWSRVTSSTDEISYGYISNPGAELTRVVLTDDGIAKRLVWDAGARTWQNFFKGPRDVCDDYGKCGAFGLCDAGAASTLFCSCLTGFSAASPAAWSLRDTSGGCKRNVKLDCVNPSNGSGSTTTTTDGFLLVQGVKLPDTHNATVDISITVEECMTRCLANCSCLAYAAADIRGGDVRSGCVMWTDDIIDLRYVDKGQDLYLRLAKSELPSPRRRTFPTAPVVAGASAAAVVAVILIVLLVVVVIRRRRRRPIILAVQSASSSVPSAGAGQPSPPLTVPSAELSTLRRATNDFSVDNVIGRGGFSTVYEGNLTDGRKVAVKRLTRSYLTDDEGGETFMRQVEVMSKLKHDNLAELLAYCKDGNERILVYEYMENRSLNLYIFARDPNHHARALLNWERRLEIIVGVARGVAYLHGQEVIHRDLKPSNILLDGNWRAKIADFDTAKVFVDDQTNPTLVQTEGYRAPEYTAQGPRLTLKCDVYSFGVVLLEIISGKRNSSTPTLLSDAQESWNQHKIQEDLLDSSAVGQPEPETLLQLERCVQVGLICVQQSPVDRPSMAEVVTMLTTNGSSSRSSSSSQVRRPDSSAASPLATQDASGAHGDSIYLT